MVVFVEPVIVGVDQSFTATGVCVISKAGDINEVVTIELPKESKHWEDVEKISFIVDEVVKITGKWIPCKVALEQYAFNMFGNYRTKAGELGGVLKYVLYKQGLEVKQISITSHKKNFCGKGNATKEEMLEEAKKRYPSIFTDIKQNNVVDALSIALKFKMTLNET